MKAWWERNAELVFCIVYTVLMLWLFVAARSFAASCTSVSGIEPRYLTHKIDGDTISIFSLIEGRVKFRIEGIDTPERGQPGWAEATAFTWAWLHQGPFDLHTCWKRTLDRSVATVSRNGETLADALRQAGHVKAQ